MATQRINACAYCGQEFVRKTLIKNGINAGKFTYSKVKYCDEHKHLSFGKSAFTRKGKQTNNALLKWRMNGGAPWNKGMKGPRKQYHCIDCEGPISRGAKRCSDCSGKLRRGENNPNWKGGITPKNTLQRKIFQQTIQKQIFQRDDYTCQLCGEHGGKLQVDHIQSWAEYVELRFNIDNCRTVCMDCHYFITFNKPLPENIKAWGHNLSKGGETT